MSSHIHTVVPCPTLTDPHNGAIYCSLGENGIPSYNDTCSFTCNTGYELTGSDTRTCQNDGSWSGSETICRRSMLILYRTCEMCGFHQSIYSLQKN